MAGNDDGVGFGDFMFFSSSNLINGPGFSVNNTTTAAVTANDDEDDDWGDFINSGSNIPRTGSLPVNGIQFDPFPKSPLPSTPGSAPSRVESVKTQWDKMNGALPLSIFGEEEKEDEGSVAVDAGLNGMNCSFSFPKTGGNLKGKGSDLNDLIGDLYKQNEKGNESNGFRSGVDDVKPVIDLNPKVETWNRNGLTSGINGLNLKMDSLDLGGNGVASVNKEENLGSHGYAFGMEIQGTNLGLNGLNFGSNGSGLDKKGLNLDSNVGNSDLVDEEDDDGWEFKAAEPKAETAVENLKSNPNVPVSNFNMFPSSWDPLGENASVLSSNINVVAANTSSTNSIVVDEIDEFSDDDDDGWEFKAAEPETRFGTDDTKVEGPEQGNPRGPEFSFGFGNSVNGSSESFGTSVGISNKPGEWNLGFSFSPNFESQNKQNDTKNVDISSSVGKTIGSDEMSWDFKDATSGNGLETKEEPEVFDASSSGVEDFSFCSHIQGNEDTSKKSKGALPLSIFGDEEVETEDPLRYEDVSIEHNTLRAGIKNTHPNISINDLISSLYSQAEKKATLNQISEPSENGFLYSHIVVGSDLANGDNDFDDDSWEFKDAISGTRGENQNSPFGFGDSYEKYSTKIELNDYVDLYSKLTSELYFVALSHLDNMKKDERIAAPSGEDSELKAIEKEIQDLFNELQKDGIISEVALENLPSRNIHLGEFAKVLLEKKFQVLESEYQLSEKLSLAEKSLASAVELLRHAASTLRILKLGSVEDQSNYVTTWSRILSVCELELKQGAMIWKQSLQNNIHNELLSKPQGRQYILALGEIFRVVRIVGSFSTKLYKPWMLFSFESHTNFLALVRECFTVWSSSGLENALQSMTHSTDLKYDVEALLVSIRSIPDPDVHELHKQVFSGQEPTCCLSGLTAAAVPGMKMVLWGGRHYFVTIANLWANLVSRDPPNLPHIHARIC